MSDRDREKRRAKKLEKQKKKRANAARAGKDRQPAGGDPARGRQWPTADCFVSEGWDEPGAPVRAVLSRANAEGAAVVAVFEIDRTAGRLLRASARGGLRAEHVAGECARVSEEAGGIALVEAAPGLIAGLVAEGRATPEDPPGAAEALALLAGIEPLEIEPLPRDGADPAAEPASGGWLSGLRKRLFG